MSVKTIVGAASPDEPRRMSVDEADVLVDDVAVELVLAEWSARLHYGNEFPDRYRPVLPVLTPAELREAGRRMRQLRRQRGRAYRFVCSRAAAVRREALG